MASNRRRDGAGNPLGLVLAIIVGTTMAISTFLPLTEPVDVFGTVRSNTLIQHGGWWLIAAALGIPVSAYWVSQRNADTWILPVLGSIGAGAWTAYLAAGKGSRTLYPVDASGLPDMAQPGVVALLGIALCHRLDRLINQSLRRAAYFRSPPCTVRRPPKLLTWPADASLVAKTSLVIVS